MSVFHSMLSCFYLVANLLGLAAYAPQLLRLLRSPECRRALAPLTWWCWTVCAATEVAYASIIRGWPIVIVASGHLLACAMIALLATGTRMVAGRQADAIAKPKVDASVPMTEHAKVSLPHASPVARI